MAGRSRLGTRFEFKSEERQKKDSPHRETPLRGDQALVLLFLLSPRKPRSYLLGEQGQNRQPWIWNLRRADELLLRTWNLQLTHLRSLRHLAIRQSYDRLV